MNNVLFLDIPSILKTHSKNSFPKNREDWYITDEVKDIIKKHTDLNYKVFLIGNYPDIPVRKRENNPIENLFLNIAMTLEKEFKIEKNSINYDYATDVESFDYLPLPGMLFSLATEHEVILGYSFIITNIALGRFIQTYSSVKPIII